MLFIAFYMTVSLWQLWHYAYSSIKHRRMHSCGNPPLKFKSPIPEWNPNRGINSLFLIKRFYYFIIASLDPPIFVGQRISFSPPSLPPWRDYSSPRSSLKRREKKGGRGGDLYEKFVLALRTHRCGERAERVNERRFYFPSPGSGMKGRGKKRGKKREGRRETREE